MPFNALYLLATMVASVVSNRQRQLENNLKTT